MGEVEREYQAARRERLKLERALHTMDVKDVLFKRVATSLLTSEKYGPRFVQGDGVDTSAAHAILRAALWQLTTASGSLQGSVKGKYSVAENVYGALYKHVSRQT